MSSDGLSRFLTTTSEISPQLKTVLGFYLIIRGLVMIVLQKDVAKWDVDLHRYFRLSWRPTGKLRTVMIIVFGAISILIGVALLLVAFVPQ